MPQQKMKEESERLRGERDQIEFIALGFERWQQLYINLLMRLFIAAFPFLQIVNRAMDNSRYRSNNSNRHFFFIFFHVS